MTRAERRWWWLAVAVAAAGVGLWAAGRGVDFPVYYATALAWRRHGGPLYGRHSGLGWPMYYRYPPLFVLLFSPLTWLPRAGAAGLWAAGKVVVLAVLARALARRLRPQVAYRRWVMALVPVLVAATYLLVEFRYGNVQFYIFALVAAALWLAPRRRGAGAAALLALAAAIKVWPLFFVPYWLARRRYRAAGLAVLFTGLLTLAPMAAFGWRGNLRLLGQWERQERGTAMEAGTIWYPSQSLRGVLTRYLSHPPAAATGGKYPAVNLAAWPEAAVSRLWLVLDLLGYAGLLAWAGRSRAPAAMVDGAAFCALALLLPFAHIEDLVVLLWPAMAAGAYLARRAAWPPDSGRSRWPLRLGFAGRQRAPAGAPGVPKLPREGMRRGAAVALWAAAIGAAVIPLIPGHAAQRWLQAAGADFGVAALLLAGLIGACRGGGAAAARDRAGVLDRQLGRQTAG